ncbi:MAG: hypothetical protein HYU58_04380 [Proteobacteria bacterium]|nr:hypothetical protein [Pseudomonadota bacterium]
MASLSLRVWPSIDNKAWELAQVADKALGSALQVRVAPMKVRRKLAAEAVGPIKGRFLVTGLGELPAAPIDGLYTYMDMSDIARFGQDFPKTRLYQWLKASWVAGRPVEGRGRIFNSETEIAEYCQVYLDLYNSMKRDGYRYSGDDDICLGIAADGEIIHVRRGTHRMATAQILELPSVSARITHVDRAWAKRFVGNGRNRAPTVLAEAIKAATS